MTFRWSRCATLWVAFALSVAIGSACGDDETTPKKSDAGTSDGGKKGDGATADSSVNEDTPPTEGSKLVTWLAERHYESGAWKCESLPRAGKPPSIHGMQRVCSNALVSSHGTGEYPVGSASVKELYNAEGTTLIGHAVTVHPKAGGASAWFFFQMTEKSIYAEGFGDVASVKTKCSDCHGGAGSGYPGHDFVFNQVK